VPFVTQISQPWTVAKVTGRKYYWY